MYLLKSPGGAEFERSRARLREKETERSSTDGINKLLGVFITADCCSQEGVNGAALVSKVFAFIMERVRFGDGGAVQFLICLLVSIFLL